MSKERLTELLELVMECGRWGLSHRAALEVDNAGHHEMRVFPYVNRGGTSTTYFTDGACRYFFKEDDGWVFDPDFKKAEAHIRELLEEIKTEGE